MRQFIQDGNHFLVAQPLNVFTVGGRGQRLSGFQERHGRGAFATDSSGAMVAALASIVGRNAGQSAQMDLPTPGIDDPQHVFQSQGGLACLKVDDEAHTNPCRQSQLGLCQPKLLASDTKCTP